MLITFVAAGSTLPAEDLGSWLSACTKVEEIQSKSVRAIDVWISAEEKAPLRSIVESRVGLRLDALKIDRIYQSAGSRSKKLLITDMDSTIIQCECIDEMADAMGLKTQIADITRAAMEGKLDFREALRQRLAMLRGMSSDQLLAVYRDRVRLTRGAQELLNTCRRKNIQTVLVSGGFTFFAERIAGDLGFDYYYANSLEMKNDILTGHVSGPIVTKEAKVRLLHYHANRLGIGAGEIVCLGDGANDLPMLQAAGLGIAYRAKAVVEEAVDNRIRFTDLETAALALD